MIPPNGVRHVGLDMGKFKNAAIVAAVGIGAFTIPYIITIYIMRHNNKQLGYPVHLESRVFPLTALTYWLSKKEDNFLYW